MSKSRLHRMLQILYVFGHRLCSVSPTDPYHTSNALEALRLVWSSIPDHFVCHKEMNDAYEDVFPAEIISRAHSFYEEAIRQTVSCREPRPLSQFCRSMMRKSLVDNKCWLPDGIKRLKLPPRFKSFLNLRTDNLHPENFQAP
ncbi:hypothetical protein AVEN_203342-1 [Araneus ventricosus]|uniref:SOCS box domain-containing protein n=1 Tax=Araneus ventricosus TaxID=182803 RepID=A0A4Y2VKZ4_ARAVE|nr:hypothetical protein AVEN_96230-1 [Araneus ventricosus]GBO25271.1 hypothetical protein AVEN_203342-1 [Araneus ventricosus]